MSRPPGAVVRHVTEDGIRSDQPGRQPAQITQSARWPWVTEEGDLRFPERGDWVFPLLPEFCIEESHERLGGFVINLPQAPHGEACACQVTCPLQPEHPLTPPHLPSAAVASRE